MVPAGVELPIKFLILTFHIVLSFFAVLKISAHNYNTLMFAAAGSLSSGVV